MNLDKLKEIVPTLTIVDCLIGGGWELKSPDDDNLSIKLLPQYVEEKSGKWYKEDKWVRRYHALINWDGVYLVDVITKEQEVELGKYILAELGDKTKSDADIRKEAFIERYGD